MREFQQDQVDRFYSVNGRTIEIDPHYIRLRTDNIVIIKYYSQFTVSDTDKEVLEITNRVISSI